MYKTIFFIFLTTVLLFNNSANLVFSQSTQLKAGYYLTVAAYSKNNEDYAKAYTKKIREMGIEAEYAFFPKKNYYFVYLKYYNDFNTPIRELYQTRKNTEFDDSWVYVMRNTEVIEKALNKEVSSLNDMFAARFSDTSEVKEIDKEQQVEELDLENEKGQIKLTEEEKEISETKTTIDKTQPILSKETIGKNVFLSLFYGTNGKEVKGQVQVVDASNHKLIKKYDGNRVITIKDPKNGNGDLVLISNVFGYKKVQHDFNYYEPLDDEQYPYVTSIEDTIIVNFELGRYNKGDIVTMYNVFFFKDAAIMRPISKFEINELVSMLKENPSMKIRIHGHTNGNSHGKIITLQEGSDNYFSLTNENKTYIGSSKKLSLERSMVMKNYLVSQGINHKNIETKAWGGKAEIHHKLSNQAHKNVRVEIEIVEN
jgi:outer membrane protein OmpA-like peptidoglycan-associated protein